MTTLTVVHATDKTPASWECWRYDPDTPALYMPHPLNPATEYWVPLPRVIDQQFRERWRDHLATKTWATPSILDGLDAALAQLARDHRTTAA